MAIRKCRPLVALLGAPNTGKSTLFNRITGRSERVTNWPGTTVDVAVAEARLDSTRVCIADLPGTYSISGSGPEERFARDFILRENPDLIIVLADLTTLPRSLYLPLEILEIYPRVMLVLTKSDVLREKGVELDIEALERRLGVPVVAISALRGEGLDKLWEKIRRSLGAEIRPRIKVDYGILEPYITQIARLIEKHGVDHHMARGLAVKLLEGLEIARDTIQAIVGREGLGEILAKVKDVEKELIGRGVDPLTEIVNARYRVAEELASVLLNSRDMLREKTVEVVKVSRIDLAFINPIVGPLLSMAILFTAFLVIFGINTGFPFTLIAELAGLEWLADFFEHYSIIGVMEEVFDILAELARNAIPDHVLASLVADGIIRGVGTVISFLPLIAMVFLFIGLLEDSGLLPRIAVSVDGLFRVFGVSGKAVFPTLTGFGCNVPAVMATRILDSREERLSTLFAVSAIPCQARLVVIMALALVLSTSPIGQSLVVFYSYAVALAVYVLTLMMARRLWFRGKTSELLLEQPPLKKPSLRVVWWRVWDGVKHFLVRAGTIIFVMSVVVWAATSYGPSGYVADVSQSYAAHFGRMLAPIVHVLWGVDYEKAWRIAFAFVNGFVAKEVFIDALVMSTPLRATGSAREALAWYGLTGAQWIGILTASILYIPCVATIATIYAESRSIRLVALAIVYYVVVASLAGWLAHTLASLFGL